MINNKIFNNLNKVYEGSEKILFDGPDRSTLIQRFKDEALICGKAVSVKGRGVFNNKISQHLMSQLSYIGIKTHFIRSYSIRDQLIQSLEMFPFKVSVVNGASSKMIENFDISKDMVFTNPIIEFKFKNAIGDEILINRDHILSFNWASQGDIENIESLVLRMNDFLQGLFLSNHLRLISINFEFGKKYNFDDYEILLGDALTLDSFELSDLLSKIDFNNSRESVDKLLDTYKSIVERMRIVDLAHIVKK